jgi:hypothetical protein
VLIASFEADEDNGGMTQLLNKADAPPPKRLRLRLRFGLRTVFLAVTFLGILGIPLAIKLQRLLSIRTATRGIIAETKRLRGTFSLDASGNVSRVYFHGRPPLSDDDLAAVMPYLERLPGLRAIEIHSDRVTDTGIAQLAALANLEQLFVYDSAITDDGIKSVSSLPRLKQVFFMKAPLTDASMESFANMAQLEAIGVSSPAITDRGLAQLSPLTNLHQLNLVGTGTTDEGLRALGEALPKPPAVYDNSSAGPKQY